jgi:hypothetical protein
MFNVLRGVTRRTTSMKPVTVSMTHQQLLASPLNVTIIPGFTTHLCKAEGFLCNTKGRALPWMTHATPWPPLSPARSNVWSTGTSSHEQIVFRSPARRDGTGQFTPCACVRACVRACLRRTSA